MGRKYGPLLLIAFGSGYLLYNLKIISFSPWSVLWPVLIIWFAVTQLIESKERQHRSGNSWEIVLWLAVLTLGIYLLLPKIGITTPSIPWKIVWPAILIGIGVLKLLFGTPKFITFTRGQPKADSRTKDYKYSLIGEFRRGPSSWVLDDLKIHQAVGSINLDLTQAIIPEREAKLDISGFVGDANIYLPPGLPFKAQCSLSLGDITVLELNESGSSRHIEMQTPDYEAATKKVNIKVRWKIGNINIRQIR